MQLAVTTYGENGWPLPAPQVAVTYSDQFRVRLPRSLHAWLVREAEREGVSLNSPRPPGPERIGLGSGHPPTHLDVAAAGGWKSTAVVRDIYQQADAGTILTVVLQPAKLREARRTRATLTRYTYPVGRTRRGG